MSRYGTYIFAAILLTSTLIGCVSSHENTALTSNMLVRVGDEMLSAKQLAAAVPEGLTTADSIRFSEHYIEMWTNKALLYKQAQRNVILSQEIEQQVEDYRRELVVYEYQKQLLSEKVEQEIADSALRTYYKANIKMFVLNKNLVKGLFIKVPEDAPQLDELKRWYTSTDPSDIENIEKYSLRNTLVFEYFYDKWIELDLLLDNIPYPVENVSHFLRTTRSLAHYDKGYWYLLNIGEYKQIGEPQPYEYAQTQIKEILINQRKISFFQELYQELYHHASQAGQIEYNPKIIVTKQ